MESIVDGESPAPLKASSTPEPPLKNPKMGRSPPEESKNGIPKMNLVPRLLGRLQCRDPLRLNLTVLDTQTT